MASLLTSPLRAGHYGAHSIRHVLFPIDFSGRTHCTAPFVAAIAHRFYAKVTLLGVAQPLIYGNITEPSYPVMVDPETIRQSVQARLDTALEAELAGIDVERVAELGDPAETIIKFAHEHSVDMIMIPTHGHSAFRNMVLGSVTAKVLSDAHCAVWTSTHTEQAPFKEQALTRRVLCAVDADEKAVPLLAWAEGYAKQWGASLKVVHATPESSPEHEDCMHSKYVAAIEKLATMAGADVPVLLATGIPSDVVCGEAARQNSDLIIIGRGPEGKSDRLKTNHAIIRQATCPVISV